MNPFRAQKARPKFSSAWLCSAKNSPPPSPPSPATKFHQVAKRLAPMDAIWHTPMVPYGTLHWCHMAHSISVNLLKIDQFSLIFGHSDGAIWHTPLVPYGTHDRCHMATGTLGVCHYGGTWCPSVAGGGGEFFVSEFPNRITVTARSPPLA